MRMDTIDDVGLYLREVRRRAGLTQQEAADRAGLSRRWLSDFEGGKPTVELRLVIRLAAALSMRIDISPAPRAEFDLDEYLTRFDSRDG